MAEGDSGETRVKFLPWTGMWWSSVHGALTGPAVAPFWDTGSFPLAPTGSLSALPPAGPCPPAALTRYRL